MKRLLFLLLAVMPILLSCSSDDGFDPNSSSDIKEALLGKWYSNRVLLHKDHYLEIKKGGTICLNYRPKDSLKILGYEYNADKDEWVHKDTGKVWSLKEDGTWMFDDATNTIILYKDGSLSVQFRVIMSDDGNSWTGIKNDDAYLFERITYDD